MDYRELVAWFAGNDTGLSSEHMAAVAAGVPGNGNHPHDPSDLGRCIRLVQRVPWIRSAFPEIAASSAAWKKVIDHWDELYSLYSDECAGRDYFYAPRTCSRMRALNL